MRRPKPVSLRPMHPAHKRWFWVLMGIGIVAIVIGWSITIRDIISDHAPLIREEISEKIGEAAGMIEQKGGVMIDASSDMSQTIQQIEEAYNAEKERLEEENATQ